MPVTPQAKKALRKARKHALHNTMIRNAYKDAMKAVKKAAAAGLAELEISELLRVAQKKLDKAAKRGVLKPKTAARKLSRLIASAKKAR